MVEWDGGGKGERKGRIQETVALRRGKDLGQETRSDRRDGDDLALSS